MSHSPLLYARALWMALQDATSTEERTQIMQRFTDLIKRRKAVYLMPAIAEHLEQMIERDQVDEVSIQSAREFPELVAGAAVYKDNYLVDNTLKARFSQLAQSFQ